jgi:hypothetical protein
MTTSHNENPYESSGATNVVVPASDTSPSWPGILVACAAIYYLLSALSLPLVNKIWFGEVPPLSIIQLPKSFLKSVAHDVLMSAMNGLGLSRGSFSPDYMATHGWAMGIMTVAPALLLVLVLARLRRLPNKRRLILAVLVCAVMDAVVTFLFDNVSSLKLFNTSYF